MPKPASRPRQASLPNMPRLSARSPKTHEKLGPPFEGQEPQTCKDGKWNASCTCGWTKNYTSPVKASLGAKWHAEIWCQETKKILEIPFGSLPCAFCKDFFTVCDSLSSEKHFAQLAEHVRTAHAGQIGEPMPLPSDWEQHGWFLGNEEEATEVLPAPGSSTGRVQGGGRNRSRTTTAPTVPFLKIEDLTEEPALAKILGCQTKQAGFNDVVVKLQIRGRSYFLGLRVNNPNYGILFELFGADEAKWVGEEVLIGLEWNEFYEKNFIHVAEASGGSGKKKK